MRDRAVSLRSRWQDYVAVAQLIDTAYATDILCIVCVFNQTPYGYLCQLVQNSCVVKCFLVYSLQLARSREQDPCTDNRMHRSQRQKSELDSGYKDGTFFFVMTISRWMCSMTDSIDL